MVQANEGSTRRSMQLQRRGTLCAGQCCSHGTSWHSVAARLQVHAAGPLCPPARCRQSSSLRMQLQAAPSAAQPAARAGRSSALSETTTTNNQRTSFKQQHAPCVMARVMT